MAARAFGQFLIDQGLISQDQLAEALELQLSVNPLIGDLVVAAGWMSPSQVQEVNIAQRRTDRKFGELCLDRGYLTSRQVDELLDHQRAKRRLLGQILLDLDHVGAESLETAISEHAAEVRGAQNRSEAIALGDAKLSRLARVAVDQLTRQYLRVIKRPMGLAAVLPPSQTSLPDQAHWMQDVAGQDTFALCIAADEDVGVEIGAALTDGCPDFDSDAFSREAIGTFLALVANHVAVGVNGENAQSDIAEPVYRSADASLSPGYDPVFKAVLDAGGRKVDFVLARPLH